MQGYFETPYFEPKVEAQKKSTKEIATEMLDNFRAMFRKNEQLVDLKEEIPMESLSEINYSPFKSESVKKIFEVPSKETYSTITYESENFGGDELEPTKRMLFVIPKEFKGRVVRDVILKHRKDLSRFSGDEWDPNGAYSRVLIKDSRTETWRSWIDPAGYKSDKFAEPRSPSNPENETLHDWIATVGEVQPSLISIENVGQTEQAISNIHGIEVVFFPEKEGVTYQEQIFSPGTSFVDLDKQQREPSYGGGPHYDGKYPNAVALGGWGHDQENAMIDSDPNKQFYLDRQGRMHIKLQPGKKFVNLEMAIGDTHQDGIANKDGHVGTLGWAKIYAELATEGQADTQQLMHNVNVPPAGVLAGGPEKTDNVIQDGDEIVIESKSDTSFLMGYRIAYK